MLPCNGVDRGCADSGKITPPDQRADFHMVSHHKKGWLTDQGGKADGS
jgi:hypothetical protein